MRDEGQITSASPEDAGGQDAKEASTQFSVCISFDFDGMANWIARSEVPNPVQLSRGEFGAVAIPRILDLLASYEIRATFFVPGHTALAYPYLVERILDLGHEVGHHGWVHENPSTHASSDDERRALERGLEALAIVGAPYPQGYRAPGAAFSAWTISLLREYGFVFDSTCSASDFEPYYLREGDAWSASEPFVFGKPIEIVELPYSWSLNDFHVFEFAPPLMNQYPPSAVEETWLAEFEYAILSHPQGTFTLSLHPQTIGRGHRLVMLGRFLEHARASHASVFRPLGEVADAWRAEHPLEKWIRQDPIHAGRIV